MNWPYKEGFPASCLDESIRACAWKPTLEAPSQFTVQFIPFLIFVLNFHLEHHVPDHIFWEHLVSMIIPDNMKDKDNLSSCLKFVPLLHQLVEVFLHVFKHKVERVVLPDHLWGESFSVFWTLELCVSPLWVWSHWRATVSWGSSPPSGSSPPPRSSTSSSSSWLPPGKIFVKLFVQASTFSPVSTRCPRTTLP